MRRIFGLACVAALACAREELLHGLEEGQANQVLVALDEGEVRAQKRRDEGSEPTWRIEVQASDAARAQRVLAERELPRPRPAGFAEVFAKGSVVPTPTEERALFLHALSGELARSVEAVDGVVEARVHLALPAEDPLRAAPAPPPRAAVLVKVRPGARDRVEAFAGGLQALVAGAVPGLAPAGVSIVVAEGAASVRPSAPADATRRTVLLAAAAVAAAAALVVAAAAARDRVALPRWARWPR